MMIFLLSINPPLHKRREAQNILRSVKGPTLAKKGCLVCEIFEILADDQTILYMEQWDSVAAIREHIQSDLYAKILTVMDISTTQPEIRFYETTQSWGLELVEEFRFRKGAPGNS